MCLHVFSKQGASIHPAPAVITAPSAVARLTRWLWWLWMAPSVDQLDIAKLDTVWVQVPAQESSGCMLAGRHRLSWRRWEPSREMWFWFGVTGVGSRDVPPWDVLQLSASFQDQAIHYPLRVSETTQGLFSWKSRNIQPRIHHLKADTTEQSQHTPSTVSQQKTWHTCFTATHLSSTPPPKWGWGSGLHNCGFIQ